MCPARETDLPGTRAAGVRGAQQGYPPERSGVHRLRSSPAGKKNALLVLKRCDEILTVMFIHVTVKY